MIFLNNKSQLLKKNKPLLFEWDNVAPYKLAETQMCPGELAVLWASIPNTPFSY